MNLLRYYLIKVFINNLTDMRNDRDTSFTEIVKSSTEYLNILNTIINILRIYVQQIIR